MLDRPCILAQSHEARDIILLICQKIGSQIPICLERIADPYFPKQNVVGLSDSSPFLGGEFLHSAIGQLKEGLQGLPASGVRKEFYFYFVHGPRKEGCFTHRKPVSLSDILHK
jgi:hypothetical protein